MYFIKRIFVFYKAFIFSNFLNSNLRSIIFCGIVILEQMFLFVNSLLHIVIITMKLLVTFHIHDTGCGENIKIFPM